MCSGVMLSFAFGTLSKALLMCIQKEMKNSVFAGHAKESKTKDIRTDVDIADLKNALRKHIYRAQVEFDIQKTVCSFLILQCYQYIIIVITIMGHLLYLICLNIIFLVH